MDREYFFQGDHKIVVANGGYLTADRIKHYEDIFGELIAVRYRGKTILNY